MKTKCILVDDEPLALEVLANHIRKIDSLQVIATCQNAFEAFNVLKRKKVDLMFLDIHMPEIKGTQLVKSLTNAPKIIFTTAYREYALEGFELNAVDYLLKPVSFERFVSAIDKFNEVNYKNRIISVVDESNSKAKIINIRDKNNVHRMNTDEIIYIESFGDYIQLYTSERKITVRSTLHSIDSMLPDNQFVRIHRSTIVSLDHITSFNASFIRLGEKEFPIGITYKSAVLKALHFSSSDFDEKSEKGLL